MRIAGCEEKKDDFPSLRGRGCDMSSGSTRERERESPATSFGDHNDEARELQGACRSIVISGGEHPIRRILMLPHPQLSSQLGAEASRRLADGPALQQDIRQI